MRGLIVDSLLKCYGHGAATRRAVDGVSFRAERGKILGILGPNGSGKTTTVKAIASILDFDKGSIRFDGLDPRQDRRRYLGKVGAVLEGARNVYWRLNPLENLRYFAALHGRGWSSVNARAESLLERLGLASSRAVVVGRLSRGNQQRTALACALVCDPELVLLDEPTLGLDLESTATVRAFLPELAQADRTVIVTSHDMDFMESVCDEVVVIREGKVIVSGTVEALRSAFSAQTLCVGCAAVNALAVASRLGEGAETSECGDEATVRLVVERPENFFAAVASIAGLGTRIRSIEFGRAGFEEAFENILKAHGRAEATR